MSGDYDLLVCPACGSVNQIPDANFSEARAAALDEVERAVADIPWLDVQTDDDAGGRMIALDAAVAAIAKLRESKS